MPAATIDPPKTAGADSLITSVTGAVADVGLTVARVTYTGAYFIAYAAVFSAVFVGQALPRQNAVMKGFNDGGRAASDFLAERGGKAAKP
jgi:hypothetical protein